MLSVVVLCAFLSLQPCPKPWMLVDGFDWHVTV